MILELDFTEDDLKKIKSKWLKYKVALFIFTLIWCSISFLIFKNNSISIYWKIIVYAISIISLISFFDSLLGIKTKKDLVEKKKNLVSIRVKNKSNLRDSDTQTRDYKIFFEKNKYLAYYQVGQQEHYDKIEIGDEIYVEISKYRKWILGIKLNDLDIENKYFMQ